MAETTDRFEPFPLTDTQQAYLLGRSDMFQLGNVTTHAYFELEGDIDVARFCLAWKRLIERHDMLRAVILPERNLQQVLREPPPWSPELVDLRELPADEVDARLAELRDRLSHEVRPAGAWPLFGVTLAWLPGVRTRVYVSIDGLICDYASWHVLFTDLSAYYDDPAAELPPLEVTFREYVLAESRARGDQAFQESEKYWLDRVGTLPPSPRLPMVADPATVRHPRFTRRAGTLPPSAWTAVRKQAAQANLTPSALLLAVFAEVLTTWSTDAHFTLNVPRMNRLPLHEQVNRVVGEFASFSLLEVDNRTGDTFGERAARIQRQLWRDLAHHHTSGVRVLREIMRRQGGFDRSLMPVVLTSTLAWAGGEPTRLQRELDQVYGLSQTPQVYLDVQVDEQHGALLFNWDVVEELFPPGLIDDMFGAYRALLTGLAEGTTDWSSRDPVSPAPTATTPARALPDHPVHRSFLDQVARRPDQPAVIAAGRTLSYQEIHDRAGQVARWLRAHGADRESLVAIPMAKGWEQVVGVYGTLLAGAAYLPIDPFQPPARIGELLDRAGSTLLLSQSPVSAGAPWVAGRRTLDVDTLPGAPAEPVPNPGTGGSDLLCVIYTSGSSGRPKGVLIEHRGMRNALRETIDRFAIGPGDRCLGLTALHHDMSAFDILGVLGAGGTLVLPDADGVRDAAHWADLITRHGVTVWNSVPAMAEMLVAHLSGTADRSLPSLRLAFLGGDWIPLYLPDALTARARRLQVVSVGGPTETTLWNIWHPIGAVDPSWRSIPYGTPIANNEYRILSAELRPRPVWVTGELYCAGVGLARGYLGEPERTAESFVADPVTGQRMYRTGDLGRYLPDGTIEFIGRADARVKVRGQRIEPGEIEAALASHPRVTTAAVVAVPYPDRPGHRALAGFVTPADGAWPSTGELRAHLRERLPEHLVPATLRTLQRFPLTANGKVDRAALVRMAGDHPLAPTPPPETELDALEHLLATVWEQTLAMPVGKDDDFFALGGDSLQATRILSRLAEIFEGEDLPLRTLFSSPTVAGMARAFRDAQRAAGRLDAIARIHLDVELLSPDQVDKALLEAATGHPDADRGGDR